MNTSANNLKKLAKALNDLAEAVSAMAEDQEAPVLVGSVDEVKEAHIEKKAEEIKPVEEAFIETAAETAEPNEAKPTTVEEARGIVSKALKAGLKKEAKEILMKYGSSVSEVGEKTPWKLAELYAEIEDLLEKNNA